MKKVDWIALFGFIVISQAAGVAGSIFTAPAIPGWYEMLAKPMLTPPGWVFGPVWTILYVLMGVAAFIIWRQGLRKRPVRIALGLFFVQLVLNTLWSILFFGLQNPAAAFVGILVLWAAILATIIAFAKLSRTAAWLLVPYLLWVSFATYLNYMIWMLNA